MIKAVHSNPSKQPLIIWQNNCLASVASNSPTDPASKMVSVRSIRKDLGNGEIEPHDNTYVYKLKNLCGPVKFKRRFYTLEKINAH